MSASRSTSSVNGPTSDDDDPRVAIYDPHATNWDDDDEEDDDMDYVPAPEDSEEEDDEDDEGNFHGMLLHINIIAVWLTISRRCRGKHKQN